MENQANFKYMYSYYVALLIVLAYGKEIYAVKQLSPLMVDQFCQPPCITQSVVQPVEAKRAKRQQPNRQTIINVWFKHLNEAFTETRLKFWYKDMDGIHTAWHTFSAKNENNNVFCEIQVNQNQDYWFQVEAHETTHNSIIVRSLITKMRISDDSTIHMYIGPVSVESTEIFTTQNARDECHIDHVDVELNSEGYCVKSNNHPSNQINQSNPIIAILCSSLGGFIIILVALFLWRSRKMIYTRYKKYQHKVSANSTNLNKQNKMNKKELLDYYDSVECNLNDLDTSKAKY